MISCSLRRAAVSESVCVSVRVRSCPCKYGKSDGVEVCCFSVNRAEEHNANLQQMHVRIALLLLSLFF